MAAGGPNIPPPSRNQVEAVVAAAPGAPTHVLLNDEEAEHLPGCNFSVRKDALLRIGGFHADFTTAGDDVDICWRLRTAGGSLHFVPSAMVWHHRRFTVRGYLRQQSGYGTAEALLMKHHPSRFGPLGGARWRGAIYGDGLGLRDPTEGSIYHGPFGFAPFQAIYPQGMVAWWERFTGVLWIALAIVALMLRCPSAAAILFAASAAAAWLRTQQNSDAATQRTVSDKLLLWLLCWLQPIVREWSRLKGMLRLHARPSWHPSLPEIIIPARPLKGSFRATVQSFWSNDGVGREQWLESFRHLLGERKIPFREDDGWRRFDLETNPNAILSWAFLTVTEYHGGTRQLTRVAVVPRFNKMKLLWLACVMISLAFLIMLGNTLWRLNLPVEMFWGGALASALLFFTWPLVGCINLTQQAAGRVGLKRIEKGDEDRTNPTSPLAAGKDSCQSV